LLILIKCDNPSSKNNKGNTPLHLACKVGYIDLAKHLLTSCQCDPNIFNDEGELPLHIAAAKSQELVKLLANQDNVNQICIKSENTPLHIASGCYSPEIVKVLLEFNCDRTKPNREGNTVLHIAAANSLEIVKLVVTSEGVNLQNKKGDTPLHIASRHKRWDTMIYLIEEHNYLVGILNTNSDSAFHIMLDLFNDSYILIPSLSILSLIPTSVIDKMNVFGDTLLHIACRKADEQTVLFLIKSLGCKLDVVNQFSGIAPLHLACYRGFTEVVKLLDSYTTSNITLQAVTEASEDAKYESGDTALHIACRNGNCDILKVLLSFRHKEAFNHHNEHKDLPFHIACYQNNFKMIDLLSSYCKKFDCNAVNESGDIQLCILFAEISQTDVW
jgi:ankyrin repeat protein